RAVDAVAFQDPARLLSQCRSSRGRGDKHWCRYGKCSEIRLHLRLAPVRCPTAWALMLNEDYSSSQTSSKRQPLKTLLTIILRPFDPRLPAGGKPEVIHDRPRLILLQSPVDLPDQPFALLLVGLHRLLLEQLL